MNIVQYESEKELRKDQIIRRLADLDGADDWLDPGMVPLGQAFLRYCRLSRQVPCRPGGLERSRIPGAAATGRPGESPWS